MSDVLDGKLKEIRDRVKELQPLVDEFHRLEAADQALTGVDEPAVPTPDRTSTRRAGASTSRTGRRPAERHRNARAARA